MTADFEVLRLYLSSLSRGPQILPNRTSASQGTPEFQALGRPLENTLLHQHMEIFYLFIVLMHWLIMAAEGNQEVLRVSAHLLDTLGVCPLKSMKCLMCVFSQKWDLQKQAYNFFQFPMEGIIQMSSSDRWSNNLQKRAPYTPRSVMFYLKVHTHTSAIWSPHPPSEASNKS